MCCMWMAENTGWKNYACRFLQCFNTVSWVSFIKISLGLRRYKQKNPARLQTECNMGSWRLYLLLIGSGDCEIILTNSNFSKAGKSAYIRLTVVSPLPSGGVR